MAIPKWSSGWNRTNSIKVDFGGCPIKCCCLCFQRGLRRSFPHRRGTEAGHDISWARIPGKNFQDLFLLLSMTNTFIKFSNPLYHWHKVVSWKVVKFDKGCARKKGNGPLHSYKQKQLYFIGILWTIKFQKHETTHDKYCKKKRSTRNEPQFLPNCLRSRYKKICISVCNRDFQILNSAT